jgi:ABC-type lipoprotein export system ATPase subunit
MTNPLEYSAVERPTFKNVLVLGNIGAGKSTFLNKLGHCIKNCIDLE